MDSAADSDSEEVLGEDLALEEAGDGAGAHTCHLWIIRPPGRCLTAFPFLMAIPTGWDIRPTLIPPGHLRPALSKNKKNK